MSQRSLVEVNHDQLFMVERHQRQFLDALIAFGNSNSPMNADTLARFGFKVFGTRHHSEAYDIRWGTVRISSMPEYEAAGAGTNK